MAESLQEIEKELEEVVKQLKSISFDALKGNKVATAAAFALVEKKFSLIAAANKLHEPSLASSPVIIRDADVSFRDGPVLSHADGKRYTNRKSWDGHLKAHGCQEIGNDKSFLNKKREVRGDFNVRKELTQATKQALGRY